MYSSRVIHAGHLPHVYVMEEINGLQSATILGHFLSASNNTDGTKKLMVLRGCDECVLNVQQTAYRVNIRTQGKGVVT